MDQRDINSRTRADCYGLRPDIYDALSGNMVTNDSVDEKIESSLSDLLPMSGGCKITRTTGYFDRNTFLPFNSQVGEVKGCEIHPTDGIVLNAIGQWDVTCRVVVLVSGGTGDVKSETRLETFDPDGNFVSRETGVLCAYRNTVQSTVTITAKVVVDRPGYRMRVYALTNAGLAQNTQWNAGDGFNILSAQYVYNGTFGGGA